MTHPPTVEQRHRDAAAALTKTLGKQFHWDRIDSDHAFRIIRDHDTERTATLEREIAALRDGLERYGRHERGHDSLGACQGVWPFRNHPCTCGLNDLLARTTLGGQP